MIIFVIAFFVSISYAEKGGASNSNVQQFMEIFNKDTLDDSTAANSSRSCIKWGSDGQLKSQAAAVQLKQHNQQQQQEIKR